MENVIETYGIISDIHHCMQKLEIAVRTLKEEGISKVLVPGDLAIDLNLRYRKKYKTEVSQDTLEEQIFDVLSYLSVEFDTVVSIPGNHDPLEGYVSAVNRLDGKVIDLYSQGSYRDGEVFIIGLPGYFEHRREVSVEEKGRVHSRSIRLLKDWGYLLDEESINQKRELYRETDGIKLVLSHGLPLTPKGKSGPDTHPAIGNLGSPALSEFYDENKEIIFIGGHQHHNGGTIYNGTHTRLQENERTKKAIINGGTLLEDVEAGDPRVTFSSIRVYQDGFIDFRAYPITEHNGELQRLIDDYHTKVSN